MTLTHETQPLVGNDAELEAALDDAHLATLLACLAQNLGDTSILRDDLAPDTSTMAMRAAGGYTPDQLPKARAAALDALKRFRDAGAPVDPALPDSELPKILGFLTGGGLDGRYVPLLLEELTYPVKDARAPGWTVDELAPGRHFSAIIVGAGMSGLLAAYRCKQAGIDYTVIEKNPGVGGTWLENTYPGCRVDNSNHMYSYSFAQKLDWPYFYSTSGVLKEYLGDCAEAFGVKGKIQYNTEVVDATWNEDEATWQVRVKKAGGAMETLTANAFITATGQLNRPRLPDIEGRDSFEGPAFHSARWDHSVDLKGKAVAVIGNGASASQLIPEVAKDAAELYVFQRTPNWYASVPNYHDPVPEKLEWLFAHVPRYAQWYRFFLFWTTTEGLVPSARVDEGWDGNPASIGKANDELRALMIQYLERSFEDRPDLLEKVIPKYPPASKRIVLDNGVWPAALKRDNVHLVTEPIDRITPRGVQTSDGKEYAVDNVIYATGFQASKFLTPMEVYGRDGVSLNEQWDGDARAYMGVTVPYFPNFFMLYGPNTNIVVNGSTVYFAELEVKYTMHCLRLLMETGNGSLDVRPDVHDRYNEWIDRGNLGMAWGVAEVPSWYRNEKNRSAQNWPFTLLEFWDQTQDVNAEDYVLA